MCLYLQEHGLDIFVEFYHLQHVVFRMGTLLCIGTSFSLDLARSFSLQLNFNPNKKKTPQSLRFVFLFLFLFSGVFFFRSLPEKFTL